MRLTGGHGGLPLKRSASFLAQVSSRGARMSARLSSAYPAFCSARCLRLRSGIQGLRAGWRRAEGASCFCLLLLLLLLLLLALQVVGAARELLRAAGSR